ncbi:roadblock/LC7 domain-containing protein [Streptomyces sp. NBC_01275]|uniref:roadblock/LC7 domain-containing protein n=1 Tax=Streptomyces sp. NBC_01275 TaxID=2903807 RepID=UPI002254B70C|nr:roadblock/LC7 domain-containing protein [Streptomyces sp. NBC_01275]MCX4761928.1 roadblock/LC7 domain-containing protein [Streptomyces sp. NBC_01275]
MTYDTTAPVISPKEVQDQMARLLDELVQDTAGVTHALLASRDGIRQAIPSHMDEDWADELAAAFSGLAGLAKGVTGPTDKQMPAGQILVEREDTLFLVTEAGTGSAFIASGKTVATVLVVLARTDANVGTVAFAAGRLVQRFAPYMTTPVRTRHGQGSGVE